jgi:hypothetical protein
VARRSIGFPLVVGIVLLLLVLALAVGWQILLVSDVRIASRGLSSLDWVLLIAGGVFFLLVIVGLVWLCAWLVREMRTNQRQRAFLDAVTHEMRTPLASLRLYLDTIVRHDPEPRSAGSSWRGCTPTSSGSTAPLEQGWPRLAPRSPAGPPRSAWCRSRTCWASASRRSAPTTGCRTQPCASTAPMRPFEATPASSRWCSATCWRTR